MKLLNSTDFPTPFLRRMLGWVRREVGLQAKAVKSVRVTNTNDSHRGRAWYSSVLLRIGPAARFPTRRYKYHGAQCPEYADRLEALVGLAAHEFRHLVRYRSSRKNSGDLAEGECVAWERAVADRFRSNRGALEAEWSLVPERSAALAPASSLVAKRAAKAEEDLKRWKAKLKLAQTKVRKLTKRAAYYRKRDD